VHSHHAVLDFAATAAPLPIGPDGVRAGFDRGRLVNHANGFRMRVLLGHQLLATLAQSFFVPLDGFQKTL
jgi:hypothetical protein